MVAVPQDSLGPDVLTGLPRGHPKNTMLKMGMLLKSEYLSEFSQREKWATCACCVLPRVNTTAACPQRGTKQTLLGHGGREVGSHCKAKPPVLISGGGT